MHRMMIFTMIILLPILCFARNKARNKASDGKDPDKDALVREAISCFDPATMIADEPEVAAKPFPRHWIWIIGLYAAAIVVLWCAAILILIPNSYAHKRMLEREGNFTALIALEPENAEWFYRRGARERNPYRAVHDLDRAILLDPNHAAAYAARARKRLEQRCPWGGTGSPFGVRSATLVDGEVVMMPITEEQIKRTEEHFERNKAEFALDDINVAIRLEPNNFRHYRQRAWIYHALGDFDKAERDFDEVIRQNPTSYSYWMRGHFFDNMREDFQRALTDYTTAIQLSEQEAASRFGISEFPLKILYLHRGGLYEKLGEPEKAAADFGRAEQEW